MKSPITYDGATLASLSRLILEKLGFKDQKPVSVKEITTTTIVLRRTMYEEDLEVPLYDSIREEMIKRHWAQLGGI